MTNKKFKKVLYFQVFSESGGHVDAKDIVPQSSENITINLVQEFPLLYSNNVLWRSLTEYIHGELNLDDRNPIDNTIRFERDGRITNIPPVLEVVLRAKINEIMG